MQNNNNIIFIIIVNAQITVGTYIVYNISEIPSNYICYCNGYVIIYIAVNREK